MRDVPITITCPKCGQEKETQTVTSTKCPGCGYLIWVGKGNGNVQRIAGNSRPHHVSSRGGLAGYCTGCGLMRMKYERGGCSRCGESGVTQKAPPPAEIVARGNLSYLMMAAV